MISIAAQQAKFFLALMNSQEERALTYERAALALTMAADDISLDYRMPDAPDLVRDMEAIYRCIHKYTDKMHVCRSRAAEYKEKLIGLSLPSARASH